MKGSKILGITILTIGGFALLSGSAAQNSSNGGGVAGSGIFSLPTSTGFTETAPAIGNLPTINITESSLPQGTPLSSTSTSTKKSSYSSNAVTKAASGGAVKDSNGKLVAIEDASTGKSYIPTKLEQAVGKPLVSSSNRSNIKKTSTEPSSVFKFLPSRGSFF